MSIEAMKKALDVLIEINKLSVGEDAIALPGEIDGAMDNLRAAIEQHDQTSLELCEKCGWKALIPGDGCLVCARQKTKPAAWVYPEFWDHLKRVNCGTAYRSPDDGMQPLYTAPRQWVGLTEDEIHHAFCYVEYETPNDWNADPERWCQQFARYLEQRLKEKNHAG